MKTRKQFIKTALSTTASVACGSTLLGKHITKIKKIDRDFYRVLYDSQLYDIYATLDKTNEQKLFKQNLKNTIFSIKEDGITIAKNKKGAALELTPFEITGIGNTHDKAVSNLIHNEVARGINLLIHSALNNSNKVTPLQYGYMENTVNENELVHLIAQVEHNRLLVDKIIYYPDDKIFDNINVDAFAGSNPLSDTYLGNLWGINLMRLWYMPVHMMIAVAEGKYMGLRKVYSVDVKKQKSKFYATGKFALAVCNPQAIALACSIHRCSITPDKKLKNSFV